MDNSPSCFLPQIKSQISWIWPLLVNNSEGGATVSSSHLHTCLFQSKAGLNCQSWSLSLFYSIIQKQIEKWPLDHNFNSQIFGKKKEKEWVVYCILPLGFTFSGLFHPLSLYKLSGLEMFIFPPKSGLYFWLFTGKIYLAGDLFMWNGYWSVENHQSLGRKHLCLLCKNIFLFHC